MVTSVTEYGHAGGFILSEAPGQRSRENVTLLSGQVIKAGTVLGKITSGGKYVAHDNNASDGTQASAAISINDVDATAGDTLIAVIARDAEVNGYELIYKVTSPVVVRAASDADLLVQGIVVRYGSTAHA